MIFSPENQFKKPKKSNETYRKELSLALQKMSHRVNGELKTKLLSDDGSVSMKQYGFSREEIEADKAKMKKREDSWLLRDLGLTPGSEISPDMRVSWEAQQKAKMESPHHKSDLVEMAATLYLDKGLREKYVIARTSKYDDYFGGDNLIVNKETGAVLCAFDDAHDRRDGEVENKKRQDVKESAKRGGMTVKYGFTFENGELAKRTIHNVPKFYMSLTPSELENALEAYDPESETMSERERHFFNLMLADFEEQFDMIKENSSHPKLLKNLTGFAAELPTLKQAV